MAKKAHPKVGKAAGKVVRKVTSAASVTAPAPAVKAVKPKAVGGVCSGCGYWDPLSAAVAKVGRCRVASPAIFTSTASPTTAAWPITRADDWCGEWVAAS